MADKPAVESTVEVFISRIRYADFVQVHYLDEGGPRVLEFHPALSKGDPALKILEIGLKQMLVSKLFTCRGCDRCDGKGAGTLWVMTSQGKLFMLPWGEYEE